MNLSVDPPKIDRKLFFDDLDKMSFIELAKKYNFDGETRRKSKLRKIGGMCRNIVRITRLNPRAVCQFIRLNKISEILQGKMIIPTPHTIITVKKGGKIVKNGVIIIGAKKFPKSKLETRILVDENAILEFEGGVSIGYGADIEVFPNAIVKFGNGVSTNIGTTIICQERVEIGNNTMLGRHITIRDNNGRHYMNRQGYKNSRPVIIGDKCWLTESCTIMPGVKIGDGAIIGALSFVIKNVPPNVVVSGHPAEVVDEDVLWKY